MKEQPRSYKADTTKAQTWEFIENRFTNDWGGQHFQMLHLIRHIKNTELVNRLFGYSSMDKLVISIYENIEHRKEALHITFDLQTKKWHFEYFATPFKNPEFVRTYPAGSGIEKFEKFIKMIGW